MALNDIAYQGIKQMIIEGTIPMGARVLETKLVPLLEMSRTPIREAMQQLHIEGLLEREGNEYRAKRYTAQQVLEIYDCRAILESEAVKLIAEQGMPDHILERITETLDRCERIVMDLKELEGGLEKQHRRAFLDQNNIFHGALYSACPNRMLLDLLKRTETLPNEIRNYNRFTWAQIYASHISHKQMIKAIVSRDKERAAALMKEHIWEARDRMIPELRGSAQHADEVCLAGET